MCGAPLLLWWGVWTGAATLEKHSVVTKMSVLHFTCDRPTYSSVFAQEKRKRVHTLVGKGSLQLTSQQPKYGTGPPHPPQGDGKDKRSLSTQKDNSQ